MNITRLLCNLLLVLDDGPFLLLDSLVHLPELSSEIVPLGSDTLRTSSLSIKCIFGFGELSLKVSDLLMKFHDRGMLKE